MGCWASLKLMEKQGGWGGSTMGSLYWRASPEQKTAIRLLWHAIRTPPFQLTAGKPVPNMYYQWTSAVV